MENLKIKVNGKKDGDLAQNLFFNLGYGFDGCKIKTIQHLEYTSDYYFFAYAHDMDLTHSCDYGVFMNKAHKEITLQELRDMAVLKRESLNDKIATAEVARQKTASQWELQVGGDHYKSMKIQPAKFALENKLDYCQANAIKYICRHASKNGKQDLEKAKHYIDLLIEHYYGYSITVDQ